MSRYRFELATSDDDAELRHILSATPMPGMISVRLQREPSYFQSIAVEGTCRQVLALRDLDEGRLVGLGTRSIRQRFVNGKPTPIGYLSNLRILKEHQRKGLLARGYRFLHQLHQDGQTPIYLTTIADDNQAALAVLTSGRAGLPRYYPAGQFHTAVIPLTRKRNHPQNAVTIRRAKMEDIPLIVQFAQDIGRRYQFFPWYESNDFLDPAGSLRGLKPEDILLAFQDNRLAGMLAGWDQQAFRQEVIHGYGNPLRWVRAGYNLWAKIRGLPQLPKPGCSLRCLMGALPLIDNSRPEVFTALLNELIFERSGRKWDYLLVGLHDSDPLLPVLRQFTARWYITRGYTVCWDDGEALRLSMDDRPTYLELGSL